ncbi:MAG: hypothetical protein FWF20_09110 [Betaproteobacteria bacterium]|nr:hypothetical protein [Betaproteobacteria bacterium]MCL2886921.1 hypothetical protein [Betaproteobacteria bacterium]
MNHEDTEYYLRVRDVMNFIAGVAWLAVKMAFAFIAILVTFAIIIFKAPWRT